jgi:spore germination cell wall hydrolase CwlJ-like protein
MFPIFRAAAATGLFIAALGLAAAPASAQTGIFDHAAAAAPVSALGLNSAVAAAPVRPAIAQASQASVGAFEHAVGLANVAAPATLTLESDVARLAAVETAGAEEDCLANAVYFEARGESLEGQLAVAEVVLNRARSGRYPATWCGVVTQHAQFSFVRGGVIPAANRSSEAWKRAVAIARIAQQGSNRMLAANVLWYHANYVSPSWGRRLARSSVIGAHIFYR